MEMFKISTARPSFFPGYRPAPPLHDPPPWRLYVFIIYMYRFIFVIAKCYNIIMLCRSSDCCRGRSTFRPPSPWLPRGKWQRRRRRRRRRPVYACLFPVGRRLRLVFHRDNRRHEETMLGPWGGLLKCRGGYIRGRPSIAPSSYIYAFRPVTVAVQPVRILCMPRRSMTLLLFYIQSRKKKKSGLS